LHAQRLMRALAVVLLHEVIEARLLLKDIRGSWSRGGFFQREVHAFMSAVLLGVAGRDALQADPQPEPPHGQFAQAVQRPRGRQGHAVVRANRGRQPELLKHALKDGKRRELARGFERFTSQEVAARKVRDRQRVTVAAVLEKKLALEIRAPERVRL